MKTGLISAFLQTHRR